MNETDNTRDLSTAPRDSRQVSTEFKTGGKRCSARSTRTGEPCKRPAMLGGNVCYHHGGNAPQVKAKAQRRLQQAADALVQRLLGMALDGDTPDHVALAAIRDALDRAGLGAKQAVEVEVAVQPWQELMGDVAKLTKAQHDAIYHPERVAPPAALPPAEDALEIVDAELVPDPHDVPPDSTEATPDAADRAERRRPAFAEPTEPPSRDLVPLEDATSDAARANRAARVVQVRRKR